MDPVFAFLDNPLMLLALGAIAVVLFGERLPEVARSIGKNLMELKKGVGGLHDEIRSAIDSAVSTTTTTATSTSDYERPADREEATAPKFEPPKMSQPPTPGP